MAPPSSRSRRLAALVALGGLVGCRAPQPPVTDLPATGVAAVAAPSWLPAGWVRRDPPDWFAPERALVETYAPANATAPLVMLAVYRPAEAARLAAQHADPARWLHDRLAEALKLQACRLEPPVAWRGGWRSAFRWPERDPLGATWHGTLALRRTADAGLLALLLVLPQRDDQGLTERLLAASPAAATSSPPR